MRQKELGGVRKKKGEGSLKEGEAGAQVQGTTFVKG